MALSAAVVWEIRSTATAANVNGGGFKTGATGVDYSQQDAAQYALTGLTSAGAGAVILTASAAADMVGNIINIASGTNFTVGFYEITAVSAGVSITTDRNCTSGVGAAGVAKVGGALSLNSSSGTTDTNVAAAFVASNTVWFKGPLTLAATFTVGSGASGTPIKLAGYNAARGDNPTAANRPTINCATFTLTTGTFNLMESLIITGSAANLVTYSGSTGSYVKNCKFTNTSTTATRVALNMFGVCLAIDCELTSYRGTAVALANDGIVHGCYIHDSDIGIAKSGNQSYEIRDCIIESNVTKAIDVATGITTARGMIIGNTLYGGENKTGVGIAIAGTSAGTNIYNNIIYGFTTGISDANGTSKGDYNCTFNNTSNTSGYTDFGHSITTTPAISGVAQLTGTNGSTSGSVLTSPGADFSTVIDNRDFCYLVSGTGITAGQYLITAHTGTTLTLSSAPGTNATTDKVFQVTTGHNFSITSANVKAIAFPHAFQAGLTTSYGDLGGVQRDSTLDQPAEADVRSGSSYNGGTRIGTLVSGTKHLGPTRMG